MIERHSSDGRFKEHTICYNCVEKDLEITQLKAELESVKLLKDIENIPTLDLRSCHCKILFKENTELKAELERVKNSLHQWEDNA